MKKIRYDVILYPLLIVLSFVLIFAMIYKDNQAMPPMLMKVTFQGEYETENGDWQEVEQCRNIPFINGEAHLKGYFQLETTDGMVVGKVPKDIHMTAYFNHIGGQINLNGETVHIFDMENSQLGISSCGEDWIKFDNPADENDIVEIILRNPHKYGNTGAVNTFLESLYTYSGAAFDEQMTEEGAMQRTSGIVIMVVSFILLGVAVFSTILKVPYSRMLWIFGFMILSAGCYCLIDSPNFCMCGNSVVINTTVKHLCIMLYPAFLFLLTEMCLKDKVKKAGRVITGIYGVLSVAALVIAAAGGKLIYDLNYGLIFVQLAAALILMVLCALSFKKSDVRQVIMTSVCLVTLIALVTDISAVLLGTWNTAAASGIAFMAVFICSLFYSLRIIPLNIKESIRAKELQLELQENRIAVMMSQIRPHFLYNALSAICDLCSTEPLKARDALVDFSVFLRENMDAITSSEPVPFKQELSHIKTYIKLEKLRFGDRINVVYDIPEDDFNIQPLTIQPIVENAIKHGIRLKENGGTVTLRTREENGIITITVSDDGVGFDTNSPKTNSGSRSHVGLENVRSRVEKYTDGRFTVESEKGKGTVVTISFRK
ncbi:MAG: histidine kinase [Oscillospiraceae bacterium]|nr:histidine kinase [Oscillospiraceae bacterium]